MEKTAADSRLGRRFAPPTFRTAPATDQCQITPSLPASVDGNPEYQGGNDDQQKD